MATSPNPYDQFEANPYDSFDETPKPPLEEAGAFLKAATRFTPIGLMARGNEALNSLLDSAAYKTGGLVTDITGSPELGFAANVGVQALPMIPGGAYAKRLSPILEGTAKGLMQSALKPTIADLQTGKATRAIDTLLAEKVIPTHASVQKLRRAGEAANKAVAGEIAKSTATVEKNSVASRLQDVISGIEKSSLNPQERVRDIEKIYKDVVRNGLVPDNIPVEQAQKIKLGIYKTLKKEYGTLGGDKVEAQKALARGLKEEIEKVVPSVVIHNKRASEMWNALNVSERRALLNLNQNPANFAWLAHSPSGFAVYLADKSAAFKGLVALMINAGKEQIPATAARIGIAGYQVSKEQ